MKKVLILGLEWDSLGIANKISDTFKERKFTDRKGLPIGSSITLGFDDGKESGFVVEGFDNTLKFGLVVSISNNRQEIHIFGGRFNESKTMKSKYHKTFKDLGKASKYLEKALTDYDTERDTK